MNFRYRITQGRHKGKLANPIIASKTNPGCILCQIRDGARTITEELPILALESSISFNNKKKKRR